MNFSFINLYEIIIIFLILTVFILLFIPKSKINFLRIFALSSSFFIFCLSLFFFYFLNADLIFYQSRYIFDWLFFFNFFFSIGLDAMSVFFIVLSTFLIPVCILISWTSITYRLKDFLILLFIIEFLLINIFSVTDLLLFYIFFEAILIPMFLVIGVWGSRSQRVWAAYQFFFFTLVGSLFMLLGLLALYSNLGSLEYNVILNSFISEERQLFIWLSFFLSFATKIPMVPMHIWLPQAHVEAPTAGSVLLAGILLKLGGYGMIRFMLLLFPYASMYFTPFVYTLSIFAIFYGSLTTIRQIDLKRIIAYSSVAHMNYVTLGIFSNTLEGLEGSIFLMLSHGLVSSALFLCVGMLYDRYKTRIIQYYGGLAQLMPLLAIFFLFFSFSNISFPGTSGFIGEILVILSIFKVNKFIGLLASFGVIFGAIYSIWLFNRVFFGQIKNIKKFSDINRREFFILIPFVFLILFLGFFPGICLNYLHCSLSYYIV